MIWPIFVSQLHIRVKIKCLLAMVQDLSTGRTLFQGKSENGLYPFRGGSCKFVALIGERTTPFVWHQRLGHPSNDIFNKISSVIPVSSSKSSLMCHTCPLGKSTKLPFPSSSSISVSPLQLVHCDIWSSPVSSNKGSKYFIL
ncbi:unnamed protein product, partial [Prunus brigantina]